MKSNTQLNLENRGVSDVLGFVFIFALVVGSIAIIFTAGTGAVDELREGEQAQNAERAMFVFHQNAEDIHAEGVSGRDTEIQLLDSQLTFEEETVITLSDNDGQLIQTTTTPLSYQQDEYTVTYEAGALFVGDETSQFMTQDPPFRFNEETTTASLVALDGEGAVGGTATPLIILRSDGSTGDIVDLDAGEELELEIETTPERANAWEQYFERKDIEPEDGTAVDTVVVEYDTEKVAWHESQIEAFFEG